MGSLYFHAATVVLNHKPIVQLYRGLHNNRVCVIPCVRNTKLHCYCKHSILCKVRARAQIG